MSHQTFLPLIQCFSLNKIFYTVTTLCCKLILFRFTQFLLLIIEEKSPVTKNVKENVKKNAKKNVKKVIDTTKVEENKDAASAKKTKAKPEKAKPYTDSQRKDLIIYMSSWFIYRIFKILNFSL